MWALAIFMFNQSQRTALIFIVSQSRYFVWVPVLKTGAEKGSKAHFSWISSFLSEKHHISRQLHQVDLCLYLIVQTYPITISTRDPRKLRIFSSFKAGHIFPPNKIGVLLIKKDGEEILLRRWAVPAHADITIPIFIWGEWDFRRLNNLSVSHS